MIYTSNYDIIKKIDINKTISISGDKGLSVNYSGDYYKALAPKLIFWKKWHENIGKISDIENNDFYIKEYYNTVLKLLNPLEVYNELNGKILLCYENSFEFCHRHIVAAWLETELNNIIIPELILDNNIKKTTRDNYYKQKVLQLKK